MKKNHTLPPRIWRKIQSALLSLCMGLTTMPIPNEARAQASSDIAGMAMGAMTSFGNSFVQSMQQSRFAQQSAMLMASLQPQVTRARFFPQCTTSVARQNFPVNACREITDPGALMLAEGLATLATNYDNFYQQLLSPAQNTPVPVGVQCLDENRKQVESELSEKLNALTRLQSQIKKNNQLFRDANAQVLENMRGIKGELDGGDENTLAGKGRDLTQFFQDAACQEAMNQGALSEAKGLRGARALFTVGDPPLRTAAAQFQQDEGVIRQHLETQVERIVADIQRDGIDRWLATQGASLERARNGGLTAFEGLKAAIGNELQVFNAEKAQIQSELQAVGVALPQFDRHFSSNVEGFKRNAGEFLRKRFVNECVNGGGQTGVALSTDQILNGLRLQGSARGGTTITDFRLALGNILNSDSFIEDKMAQISALEQRVGGGQIKVEFVNEQAQRTFVTPFELYRQTIDRCAARFETDETFSPQTAGGDKAPITADVTSRQSRSEQLDRASRYLEDAKRLEAGFISRISGSVRTRVLECGGGSSAGATRSGQCNPNAMTTSNTDFCINTAATCATNIQSCFAKVDQIVKQKEQQIQVHATTFNENMRGLVARQEQVLQTIRGQVERDQQFLRRFFPGANFELPADMFVAMPEMQNSEEFGVQLLNGGNLNFLDAVADKIDDLKASLETQKGSVNQAIEQYMNEQKTAMEQDRARWSALKTDCEAKANQFRQQVAQRNEAGAKAAQEQGAKVNEFCFKYDRLRNTANPTGGCEGSNSPSTLMGEANRIAAHLDPTVVANLDEFARVCSQSNNHRSSENGEGSEAKAPTEPILQRVCEAGGVPEGLSVVTNEISRNLPPGLRSHRGAVMRYMRGTGPDSALDDIEGMKSGALRTAANEMRTISRDGSRDSEPAREVAATSATAGAATGAAATPRVPSAAETTARTGIRESRTAVATHTAAVATANATATPAIVAGTAIPMPTCTPALNPAPTSGQTLQQYIEGLVPETLGSATAPANPNASELTNKETSLTSLGTCLTAAQAALSSASPAVACTGTTLCADRYNPLISDVLRMRDNVSLLRQELAANPPPASSPATPSTATSSRSGVCGEIDREITSQCSATNRGAGGTDAESLSTCRTRVTRELYRNPPSAAGRELRSRLSSITEAFRSGGDEDDRSLETWSAIGERGSGSCAASNSGARAGGAMATFLQSFDQRTIGAGATGR